jgi:NAD(P)-dependent dehydrogenase (short-subunit alcohol dehydrogenase family)
MSVKKLLDLSGKVALITGGSRGLGLQMAEALGEMGAKVVITARKASELDEAKAHLEGMGIDAMTVVNDLQDSHSVQPMVEGVLKARGQIDILINNAGAAWGAPAEEHSLEAWNKIINIASIAGLVGTDPGFMPTIAYNSSKGGVINFTRSLGAEWARFNITVNAIAPGVFPSKMSAGMIDRAEEYIMNQTPMKRLGGDEDLKGAAVLLASDASAYMTGQTIAVDGGFSSI